MEKICECCNVKFITTKKKQKYCSKVCGQCNKRQVKILKECEFTGCTNTFEKLPNGLKILCSRKCQVEWQKYYQLGENNPNYGNRKPNMFKHTEEVKKIIKEKVKESWKKKERLEKHLSFFDRHRLEDGSMDWHTDEFRNKISIANTNRISDGLNVYCDGEYLSYKTKQLEFYDSSWELLRMVELDNDNDVKFWTKKHKIYVKYEFNGQVRRHIPDFYILKNDGIIFIEEIKGWVKDEEKLKCQISSIKEYCVIHDIKYLINFFTEKNKDKYKHILEWEKLN
jgi:hypothetical protein